MTTDDVTLLAVENLLINRPCQPRQVGNCGKYMLTGKNVNKTEGFYN